MSKLQHKVECLKPDEDDEWRKGTLPPTQPPLAEGGCHSLLVAHLKHKTENWQLSMAKKGKSGREIRKGTQTETETETVAGAAFAAASGKDIWQCAWYSRTKCAIYIQISALKKRETKQIKKGGSHKAYARCCCCSCFKAAKRKLKGQAAGQNIFSFI